ncbi:hypothetical protein [Sinomonas gamaensis]|uniref:hypothetical protein n=1 Tax=Sinomonas gamaensis TaxID=2565624 RepID=UPI00110963AE|nr:hypothetical protein [Sinomonas gamaensis]
MSSTPPRPKRLREDFGLDAAWLAARIEASPIILGVGTGLPAFERTILHERPDQFAVILFHPADGVRRVVEVQLGDADQEQLARALQHWEDERVRLPRVEHRVAIAAERIPDDVAQSASRIQAHVPLEVVELHAEKTGNIVAVHGEPVTLPHLDGGPSEAES